MIVCGNVLPSRLVPPHRVSDPPLIQAKFKSIYKPLGFVRPVEIRTARSVWTPNNHPPAMKVDAPDCCDS